MQKNIKVNPFSAGIDIRRQYDIYTRQILTYKVDHRTGSVNIYSGLRLTTYVFNWIEKSQLSHLWLFQIKKQSLLSWFIQTVMQNTIA